MNGSITMQTLAENLSKTFERRETTLKWRKEQLKELCNALTSHKDEPVNLDEMFYAAHYQDLKQTKFLSKFEYNICITEIDYVLKNIDIWLRPKSRRIPVLQVPGSAYTIPFVSRSPLGVVLIIGPWNYPFQLVLLPLIGAIAAGNCVVIKPSEMAPNVSAWISKYLNKYMDSKRIVVVEGGVPETTALLKQKWNHIFYTGNPTVGKIVMQAASQHLTPVTLELGGKSPVIIDEDVDLNIVCKRLVMGKFLNMGQTCVAPDHVFIHSKVEKEFIEKMKEVMLEFFGPEPQKSPDLSRIVNKQHTLRLNAMLKAENKSSIIIGGKVDETDLYIAPTLIKPSMDGPLMTQEIFGPILPLVTFTKLDSVISRINAHGQPLALYIFSNSKENIDYIMEHTRSGAVSVNDTVSHASVRDLPFGGTGSSGFGRYYGRYTFDTFSHHRAVLWRPLWRDPSIRFPPHSDLKVAIISKLQKFTMPTQKRLGLLASAGLASFTITHYPGTIGKILASIAAIYPLSKL